MRLEPSRSDVFRARPARRVSLPGGGGRRLADALRLEPALGIDRGLAAVAGRGHGLAVAVVVDVARDEHALDLRAGLVADDEIALLVHVEPVLEHLGVRAVADRDEEAL